MSGKRLSRAAFTLVELMVVVAIIGSFMGLISLGFRPSRGTQIRQAAQSLASLLLTTQSQSLGSELGAALVIKADGIFGAATQGTVTTDVLSVSGGGVNTATVNINVADVPSNVYRARFVPTGATTLPVSPWYRTTNGLTISFDQSCSQTTENTLWPPRFYTFPNDPKCTVEYQVAPIEGGLLYRWPTLAAIDLQCSGFAGETSGLGTSVGVVFDSMGQPQVRFVGSIDAPMRGVLYFLIAYAPDIAAGGYTTLRNDDSIWVTLDFTTGHVTLAWNNPITVPSAPSAADLQQALQQARINIHNGKGLAR